MSSPIITVKVKETLELEKSGESEEEINIELETTSEMKGTKYRNRNDFRRIPFSLFVKIKRTEFKLKCNGKRLLF